MFKLGASAAASEFYEKVQVGIDVYVSYRTLILMTLKKSCFPDCRDISSLVPVFKNISERSRAKKYRPVSLPSVVSKVIEKLVNNRIVDHLEKYGLFSDFQYGFRSSRSTAYLLTVASSKIARGFLQVFGYLSCGT